MLSRLDMLTTSLTGLVQTGNPPWYPTDTGNRAMCHNGNPYYCDHGRYQGKAFIPYWDQHRTWGQVEPCVARCLVLHEFSHGSGTYVETECPAVIAEGRCLLDYLMQMASQCAPKFCYHQNRIANARDAFSQAAAGCP
jgi:hypothetical protein